MFERYTEPARRVIFFARYDASIYAAPRIEPEHVLLGMVREQPELLRSLLQPGFELENFRQELDGSQPGRAQYSADISLPLSTSSKQVLVHASEAATLLGSVPISAQHLLAGLLQVESPAQRMLLAAGLTAASLDALEQMSPAEQKAFRASMRRKTRMARLAILTRMLLVAVFALLLFQVIVRSISPDWDSRDKLFYGISFPLLASILVLPSVRLYFRAGFLRKKSRYLVILLVILLVVAEGLLLAR